MSSNHFIACQYIYIVIIKPANLPIGRNSPHFSKRGSLDKWEIGEIAADDKSLWGRNLSQLVSAFHSKYGQPHHTQSAYLITTSLHLIIPRARRECWRKSLEGVSGNGRRLCLWAIASVFGKRPRTNGDTKVCQEKLSGTRGLVETKKPIWR